MKIFLFIWLLLIRNVLEASDFQCNTKCVVQKAIEEVDSHQVVQFISENITKNSDEIIFGFKSVPRILKVFNPSFETNDVSNLDSLLIKEILHTSLIIFHTNNFSGIKYFIDFLSKSPTIHARPKCLIILNDNNFISQIQLKHLLTYSWVKKFLDLSVVYNPDVGSQLNSSIEILNFNPFFYKFSREEANRQSVIFPDKLRNTNKYPVSLLNVPFLQFQRLVRDRQGQILISGSNNLVIEYVFKTMNFEVRYTENLENLMFGADVASLIITYFKTHDVSNMGFLVHGSTNLTASMAKSSEQSANNLVALVPVIRVRKVDFTVKIIIHIVIIHCVIQSFFYFASFLKINSEHIKSFDIIRIILSQPVNREPQKVSNRIIFLTITITFILIFRDFISESVKINFNQESVPFNSYEDLSKSKMPVYATLTYSIIMQTTKDNNHLLDILKRKSLIDDVNDCVKMQLKLRDVICIMFQYEAEIFVSKYRNSDGSAILKIAQPALLFEHFFYVFEEASPYADRFAKIARRINEADFLPITFLMNNLKILEGDDYQESEDEEISVRLEAFFILCFGYIVAVLVFSVEFMIFNKNKFKKFVFISFRFVVDTIVFIMIKLKSFVTKKKKNHNK